MKEAFDVISSDPDFEEFIGVKGNIFVLGNIEHHRAVSTWASDRFPPFGNNKDKKKQNHFPERRKTKNKGSGHVLYRNPRERYSQNLQRTEGPWKIIRQNKRGDTPRQHQHR